MILSGWKEIANYLKCGVRTAQRWEEAALPVRRPVASKRGRVVADSNDLDLWIADSVLRHTDRQDVTTTILRARELCAQVQKNRQDLQANIAALRKELAALQARRKRLSREK